MTFALTYLTHSSDIFIADFESVFVSWELTTNSELHAFIGSNIPA